MKPAEVVDTSGIHAVSCLGHEHPRNWTSAEIEMRQQKEKASRKAHRQAAFPMPLHIFLRRSLAPHLSVSGARTSLRTPQARFYSPEYLRSLKARRIPWTITKEDLRKPEAELIEVVRSGIWDDPSGGMLYMPPIRDVWVEQLIV